MIKEESSTLSASEHKIHSKEELVSENVASEYAALTSFVENLNAKVRGIVGKSEEDFLLIYKDEMRVVLTELNSLRKRIDKEDFMLRKDSKILVLVEERNYFRTEALRLDKICREVERENRALQFQNNVFREDIKHFETILLELKKENKQAKAELLHLYSNRQNLPLEMKERISPDFKQRILNSPKKRTGKSLESRIKHHSQIALINQAGGDSKSQQLQPAEEADIAAESTMHSQRIQHNNNNMNSILNKKEEIDQLYPTGLLSISPSTSSILDQVVSPRTAKNSNNRSTKSSSFTMTMTVNQTPRVQTAAGAATATITGAIGMTGTASTVIASTFNTIPMLRTMSRLNKMSMEGQMTSTLSQAKFPSKTIQNEKIQALIGKKGKSEIGHFWGQKRMNGDSFDKQIRLNSLHQTQAQTLTERQ